MPRADFTLQQICISIHAPPRGATARRRRRACRGPISIHAPPRGATRGATRNALDRLFQFTPLREGRRPACRQPDGQRNISIHAPPRGATTQPSRFAICTLFQFTPLREGRQSSFRFRFQRPNISIHAPPRGATLPYPLHCPRPCISIHAPPRGATGRNYILPNIKTTFQFTPLREGRPITSGFLLALHNFNSRPSARGDCVPVTIRV